ncbi:MAG: hypothetical protein U0903_12830 [Planctomycetales bacterium]
MKRYLSSFFICFYLGVLSFGVICHTLSTGIAQHPGMYFIVWDMFCGWDSYMNHVHVIGEGESGKFYELTPAPWGEIHPYGSAGRQHYDSHLAHAHRLAMNSLKHTSHEPMLKFYVVEELWSKKFDFPDYLWKRKYEVPREPLSYFNTRLVFDGEGVLVQKNTSWFDNQVSRTIHTPRVMADLRSNRPPIIMQSPSLPRETASPGLTVSGN